MRLEKVMGEAKEQQIEDCLFPEVIVDPKDFQFRKHSTKSRIQSLSRGKAVSKGLLDNDSRISDLPGNRPQVADDAVIFYGLIRHRPCSFRRAKSE
jgi:hypothetical protein